MNKKLIGIMLTAAMAILGGILAGKKTGIVNTTARELDDGDDDKGEPEQAAATEEAKEEMDIPDTVEEDDK